MRRALAVATQCDTPASDSASKPVSLELAPQQRDAFEAFQAWFAKRSADTPVFRLFGVAGTGKTTLARTIADAVEGKVVFGAFTGKAALQLQRAGCANAQTLHSLLYKARQQPDGRVVFQRNPASDLASASLLIVDEASMVNDAMAADILYFGVPVLALGDPAQLPPVSGTGAFTTTTPDVMLTEIHRQARDNPIIRIATAIREGRPVPMGDYGAVRVISNAGLSAVDVLAHDQVLAGTRATRDRITAALRASYGRRNPAPAVGEKLVCLRNDATLGVYNGGLYTVDEIDGDGMADSYALTLRDADTPGARPFRALVHTAFFEGAADKLSPAQRRESAAFEHGLILTGHKAQGSQWRSVIAFDESAKFGKHARAWLYTVVTRASDQLTLVRK